MQMLNEKTMRLDPIAKAKGLRRIFGQMNGGETNRLEKPTFLASDREEIDILPLLYKGSMSIHIIMLVIFTI
jgi:hypothetical protein